MEQNDYDAGYTRALHDVKKLLRAVNESRRVTFSYFNVVRLLELAIDNKEKILKEGDLSEVFFDRREGFFIKGRG